jgi:hypothetical protein
LIDCWWMTGCWKGWTNFPSDSAEVMQRTGKCLPGNAPGSLASEARRLSELRICGLQHAGPMFFGGLP